MNIGAVWLLIGLIIMTIIVDLIIPAAIAKWALLAPIFIPLFIRLGVAPQTVLAAYRVGDSPVNVITPLMAYFPLIVVFTQRYKKDAGIGTVVSLMLPYVVHPDDRLDAVLRRVVPARDPARARIARKSSAGRAQPGRKPEELGFGDDRLLELVEQHALVGRVDVAVAVGRAEQQIGFRHRLLQARDERDRAAGRGVITGSLPQAVSFAAGRRVGRARCAGRESRARSPRPDVSAIPYGRRCSRGSITAAWPRRGPARDERGR